MLLSGDGVAEGRHTKPNDRKNAGDMPNPYSTRRYPSLYAPGQSLENVTLDDLCFNIEEEVTRYIRLFFAEATDPEDLWLGVAEVGFKCGNAPTAAPTTVPTPAPSVSAAPTAVPTSGAVCRPDILLPVQSGVQLPLLLSSLWLLSSFWSLALCRYPLKMKNQKLSIAVLLFGHFGHFG